VSRTREAINDRKDIVLKFPEQPLLLALLFVLLFSAGCISGQDAHYNYARAANCAAYKTHQRVEAPTVLSEADAPKSGRTVASPTLFPPSSRGGASSAQRQMNYGVENGSKGRRS
jgi:hypothetical protein